MESRGIDTVFYYQVDNPLVRMCDPTYLGFHAESGITAITANRDPRFRRSTLPGS